MKAWRLTDRILAHCSLLLTAALLFTAVPRVFASDILLQSRSNTIASPIASAVTLHEFRFTITETSVPVGSISLEYCSNSPIIGDPCTAPTGLDLSSASLTQQQGETGFAIHANSTSSRIIITRPASLPAGSPSLYRFENVINPNTEGSYYVRIETFTSTDATGLNIEQGGVVFAITAALNVTAEVPPYLTFCASVTINAFDCSTATSYFIDMGEFSASTATRASSEFVVATNAQYGYSVTLNGTTLTSGNNTIPALSGSGSSPGTSQFGINLRSNTNPSIGAERQGPGIGVVGAGYGTPNQFRFQAGDTLVTSTNSSDLNKFTVSYMTNIAASQPAGYYVTTLTYICLANF